MITIISIFDKHEDFIELQYKSILKYIKGNFDYIIFNNASNENQRMSNRLICDKFNIKCIDTNLTYINGTPSSMAGEGLNESFQYLKNKKVFKLDSDMFFMGECNLEKEFENFNILYIPNLKSFGELMWSGCFGIDLTVIKDDINFMPIVNTDTFGNSMHLINNNQYSRKKFHLLNFQKIENDIYTISYNNDCGIFINSNNEIISVENNNYFKNNYELESILEKYKHIEKDMIEFKFPSPYNIDYVYINGKKFIFHFKSSNWTIWNDYVDDYLQDKKTATKNFLNLD